MGRCGGAPLGISDAQVRNPIVRFLHLAASERLAHRRGATQIEGVVVELLPHRSELGMDLKSRRGLRHHRRRGRLGPRSRGVPRGQLRAEPRPRRRGRRSKRTWRTSEMLRRRGNRVGRRRKSDLRARSDPLAARAHVGCGATIGGALGPAVALTLDHARRVAWGRWGGGSAVDHRFRAEICSTFGNRERSRTGQ